MPVGLKKPQNIYNIYNIFQVRILLKVPNLAEGTESEPATSKSWCPDSVQLRAVFVSLLRILCSLQDQN